MVIGYMIFHSSRFNSVSTTTVHSAYWMVKENVDYDLYEAMRTQLILNLDSIKKDKNQKLKFGQLLVGLLFYFKIFIPRIGDIQWLINKLVAT